MNLKDLEKNQDVFEIRPVSQINEKDCLNKSTISVTIRNMTRREPSYVEESDRTDRYGQTGRNSDAHGAIQENTTESDDSQIDDDLIMKMNEEPVEVREQEILILSNQKKKQKLLFHYLQGAFLSHIFLLVGYYDLERVALYCDLIPSVFLALFGIKIIYKILREKMSGFKFTQSFSKSDKLISALGVIFIFETIVNVCFEIACYFDRSVRMFRLMAVGLFSLLALIILSIMIFHKIKVRKAICYLFFEIFHFMVALSYSFESQQGAIYENVDRMWPLYVAAIAVILLFLLEVIKFAFICLQLFLDLIQKSIMVSSGFNLISLVFIANWLLLWIYNSARQDTLSFGVIRAVAHGAVYICIIMQAALIIFFRFSDKMLSKDIIEATENNEKLKQANRVKIKADVPVYLKKRKTDSYFQKIGKSELAKINLGLKATDKPSAKPIDHVNKKPDSKFIEKQPNIVGLSLQAISERKANSQKDFRVSYPVQAQTLRVQCKKPVTLLEGIQHSFRKFINQGNDKAGKQTSPISTNREKILDIKETESEQRTTTDLNVTHPNANKLLTDIKETEAVENIKKVQQILTGHISERMQTSDRQNETNDDCCLICYANKSAVIIMPCGHSDICLECAKDIWTVNGLCFLCQNAINYMLVVEPVAEDVYKVAYSLYLKK